MNLPAIWISPDAHFLIVLEKVTAIVPGASGGISVRLSGDGVPLNEADGQDSTAAFLRYHMRGLPHLKTIRKKSNHDHF